jgi:putative SOS response-associated peptidase YedK
MIERYSLGVPASQIGDFFEIEPYGFDKPRFNAAPAQLLPVITAGSQGLSHFYWGTMPQWSKNKSISEKIINVHGEQIAERPTLKKSLKKYRCMVPADGFYVWKRVGKKTNIPYRVRLADKSLFGMAGFWEEFDDETGEVHHTFTIITIPSSGSLGELCERMPLIFNKADGKTWLSNGSEEADLLTLISSPPELVFDCYTISPRINSADIDEATLTQPTPPADQFGNLTLFN